MRVARDAYLRRLASGCLVDAHDPDIRIAKYLTKPVVQGSQVNRSRCKVAYEALIRVIADHGLPMRRKNASVRNSKKQQSVYAVEVVGVTHCHHIYRLENPKHIRLDARQKQMGMSHLFDYQAAEAVSDKHKWSGFKVYLALLPVRTKSLMPKGCIHLPFAARGFA